MLWNTYMSDVQYTLLLLGYFCVLVHPVRIKELRVPTAARHGAAVILDCDYTLDGPDDGEGLVVKWYLNDQSRPVYVWIPNVAGGPRGLGVLNGRLNLSYRASEDALTEHRALHISNSAPDLTGDYTCVVSTFHGEDRQTKNMLVYVPEKSLQLKRRKAGDGAVDAVCSAEGVFPEPEMIIRVTYNNVSQELAGSAVLHRQGDGLFDVLLHASLPPDDVTAPSPIEVTCELSIPEANYTVHRDLLYYPGNASRCDKCTWVALTAYGVFKYILTFR